MSNLRNGSVALSILGVKGHTVHLRIDTGGWAPFYNSVFISETIKGISVNHTSNERSYFSLSYDR